MKNLLDSKIALQSNLVRKSLAYAFRITRFLARHVGDQGKLLGNESPIIVNSIPKSGTHLLMQVARVFPQRHYFGTFIAQTPSLTLRRRSAEEIAAAVSRLAPGEVAGAHLYFDPLISRAFADRGAFHVMVIRDPADILLSEVHYLENMNRFHRMSSEYRDAPNFDARLGLAINGSSKSPSLYPDFFRRIQPYAGWLTDPQVCLVRFEDLSTSVLQQETIQKIVTAWLAHVAGRNEDIAALQTTACAAIDPARSHTITQRDRKVNRDEVLKEPLVMEARKALGYL